MRWSELYGKEHEPDDSQIKEFINIPLYEDLDDYLRREYNVKPQLFYSGCSMDNGSWDGWNIKYKKSGNALCTIYPKQGYFMVLMNVGPRELNDADMTIPLCSEYTQTLYSNAKTGAMGKSLPLEVSSREVLSDVKKLVKIRAGSKSAKQKI
ncbi:MAG: DUF3788 domain-containing protein [Clostridiales bacterium]|jgi:AraC family transcriptional regulator|nr:DUF3788 domain-containing protein [Clostridiales bacterium]